MPACQTLAPTHLETPFAVPTRLDGAPYKADKVTVKRKSGYQEKKRLSRQKVAVKAKGGCQEKKSPSREFSESGMPGSCLRAVCVGLRATPGPQAGAGGVRPGCRRRARGCRSDNRGKFTSEVGPSPQPPGWRGRGGEDACEAEHEDNGCRPDSREHYAHVVPP